LVVTSVVVEKVGVSPPPTPFALFWVLFTLANSNLSSSSSKREVVKTL
jgi:hypothetical protein